jgi:hypothetical protein
MRAIARAEASGRKDRLDRYLSIETARLGLRRRNSRRADAKPLSPATPEEGPDP